MNDIANKPSDINDWHEIREEEWQSDKCNNSQPVITEQDKQRAEQACANIIKPPIKEWQPDWSQDN